MGAALQVVRKITPTTLAVSGRFGKYEKEPLHDVRTQKVESSPVLEAMKRAWAKCTIRSLDLNKDYAKVCGKIKGFEYSAKDVDSGTGRLSSIKPLTCISIASCILRSVSSRFAPVAIQPGKSGEYAE